MTEMPATFDEAMAMLRKLIVDPNLWLGLLTLVLILALASVIAFAVVRVAR